MKKHYLDPIIDVAFLSDEDVLVVSVSEESSEVFIEDGLWGGGL